MERYPDAKVVLTVRGDGNGEAWAKSFQTAIIDVMSIMKEIPFRWIPMFQKIERIVQAMLQQRYIWLNIFFLKFCTTAFKTAA